MLLNHVRSMLLSGGSQLLKKMDIFDNKFVSLLLKNFFKFSKMRNKEDHQFSDQLREWFSGGNAKNVDAARFYFPFNFDKIHWVAICVDCVTSTIYVLDSDLALCNDTSISKELAHVAQLMPYMLKHVGHAHIGEDPKSFQVVRLRDIQQHGRHVDSAVTSVLFDQAHAIGGVEACRCITPDTLELEAKRLSVMLYEDNYEKL